MSGIGLLQPDVCEVQLAHGIGQAHQHVQLHQNEVLGRPKVEYIDRVYRSSIWIGYMDWVYGLGIWIEYIDRVYRSSI